MIRDLLTKATDVLQRFKVAMFFIIMIELARMAKLPITNETAVRDELSIIVLEH